MAASTRTDIDQLNSIDNNSLMTLGGLPIELKSMIGSYLDYQSLHKLSQTSSSFYKCYMNDIIKRSNDLQWVQFSMDYKNTFALRNNGDVYVCGSNKCGVLGLGDNTIRMNPTHNPYVKDVVQIKTRGRRTYFVLKNGNVMACGSEWSYVSFLYDNEIPKLVDGFSNIKEIAMGEGHTVALRKDGRVMGYGHNTSGGQLGFGSIKVIKTPTIIPTLSDIVQVACGIAHTLFLHKNGHVYACGKNSDGELGLGHLLDQTTPILIPGLSDVKQIACTFTTSVFLLNNGEVKVCGSGSDVRVLGRGAQKIKVPVSIPNISGVNKIAVDTLVSNIIYLLNDGNVKISGVIAAPYTLAGVERLDGFADLPQLKNAEDVEYSNDSLIIRFKDGRVAVTGDNKEGRLGLGNNIHQPSVVKSGFYAPIRDKKISADLHHSILNKSQTKP